MMIGRVCNPLKNNSFFLFGARGTGKSTLLNQMFNSSDVFRIDLLNPELEETYSKNPALLTAELDQIRKLSPHIKWVVLDEVQKVPALLNIVHRQIEMKYFKFALTGSSARKLKRGQANLLAGRAFLNHLYPFTSVELKDSFNLNDVLRWGSLPSILNFDSSQKYEYLKTYTQTYLKEEVVAEQLVRNLTPFRSFLEVAAQSAGKIINYSAIARDTSTDATTIHSYFDILEETYVGFKLNAFHESLRKRQNKNPKFYFFDLGVQRSLSKSLNVALQESSYEYGNLFEAFVILEIFRLNEYLKKDWSLSYLRTKDGLEVDLVIDRPGLPRVFIEIKSTRSIRIEKIRGFKELISEQKNCEAYVLSQDNLEFIQDGISFLPWNKGLREIGLVL
jgi:predicted AAA+ superfamily ATPase